MADSADLLFELGTEELPPVALKKLSNALKSEFIKGLDDAQLSYDDVKAYAAPRRLALQVSNCSLRQPDRDIERRGPAVQAAFDSDGNATKAAEGFARSCGVSVDELSRLKTDKGEWLAYNVHQEGDYASSLLPGIAENALNKLPIPKRMRWGDSDAQFVRPVHWLLFIHGDQVVPCTILDAISGNQTYGHRFHHPDAITINSPSDYLTLLEQQGYVLADFNQRRAKIKQLVIQSAESLGNIADLDDDLLDEVTALNEWPVPISGSFEERFLEVPQEALVLTMKENQKYFPLFDKHDKLVNHFITIANIDSPKPEVIKEGNERVVRPRLADAMFFWQQDGKKKLEDHIESLKSVVFQQKLGSMFDKSQRVAKLAASIANSIGGDTALAERAGHLSRCDLMTEIVYEFPKMQGIMGRYQANRDGENAELAQAMDEFYMPRYSGDELPQTKSGIAISLAERIDTLVGIFGIGLKPTGDKDPFGLRRAALGALRIILEHQLNIDLKQLISEATENLGDIKIDSESLNQLYPFLMDRMKGIYADKGIGAELFDSVASIDISSPNDFELRIQAVVSFKEMEQAEALAAANKRIRNILKKSDHDGSVQVNADLFADDAEKALFKELDKVSATVTPLFEQSDYQGVLTELSVLRPVVDRFFDEVMVMADDPAIKQNRLALLNQLSQQFRQVADISHLQG